MLNTNELSETVHKSAYTKQKWDHLSHPMSIKSTCRKLNLAEAINCARLEPMTLQKRMFELNAISLYGAFS